MKEPSNMPPGVTDAAIEAQMRADDDPAWCAEEGHEWGIVPGSTGHDVMGCLRCGEYQEGV